MKPAIVVTGAAAGLGREFARVAMGEGLSLLLLDQAREPLDELVADLRRQGVDAHSLVADLASSDAVDVVERELASLQLQCEVLINNAGLLLAGPILALGVPRQMALVDVNLMAPVKLALRFLPAMIERGRGSILNVGSVGAYMPGPGMAIYNATKAGLDGFSMGLARQVAGTGITVSSLVIGKMWSKPWQRTGRPKALIDLLPGSFPREIALAAWPPFRRGKTLITPQLFYRALCLWLRLWLPVLPVSLFSVVWKGRVETPYGLPEIDDRRPAIVITGASGGIGRALASALGRGKPEVVLIGRSVRPLEHLAAELTAAGARAHVIALDLAQPAIGPVIEQALVQRQLYCDRLINAAAVRSGDTDETRLRVMTVNVRALTELTVMFLPGMVARRRGGILTVARFGEVGARSVGDAASRFVASFSESARFEMKSWNVTVTCLHLTEGWISEQDASAAWQAFEAGKARVSVGRPRYLPSTCHSAAAHALPGCRAIGR